MSLKIPPYGHKLVVPQLRWIMIFSGAPQCWEHAREHEAMNLHNFLCLPDTATVTDYFWPIERCSVSVIVFIPISKSVECTLFAWLCKFEPSEISVRQWPSPNVITRVLKS